MKDKSCALLAWGKGPSFLSERCAGEKQQAKPLQKTYYYSATLRSHTLSSPLSNSCPCVAGEPCVLPTLEPALLIIGWKRPLRSSSPTISPTPPYLLNHILKCHIYMFFKHLQRWWLHHLPGQPVPMPHHSSRKEVFPNTQSEPPLMQLEAIASCPVAGYLGEETNNLSHHNLLSGSCREQ